MTKPTHELEQKLVALRGLLAAQQADALLLRRVSSFAWATCGAASYINTATTEGAASLLVTADSMYLATNNIEAPRLELEEGLRAQGWEFVVSPWATPLKGLNQLVEGKRLVSDVPFGDARVIAAQVSALRAHLTDAEVERFRGLGRLCAEAVSAAGQSLQPGMSELEIAARIGQEAQQRGVQPIVNLVAVDERAAAYRHPLPTTRTLRRYALLVLSGRKAGLVCSVSRMVHFGKPPAELQKRILAAASVNAALITHSRPGNSLGQVLEAAQQAYAAAGYAGEWQHHHQGGLVGYEPREILATPGEALRLEENHVAAWNPTVQGAKMEDSVLLNKHGFEILTGTPLWPVQMVTPADLDSPVPCAMALELYPQGVH